MSTRKKVMKPEMDKHFSLFTDFDIDLFRAGKHFRLYEKLGSHYLSDKKNSGTYFSVWAPNATYVSVVGNFNGWNREMHPMFVRWDSSGIWELYIEGIQPGELYKYFIEGKNGYKVEKADPYAYYFEVPPRTASVVYSTSYKWKDSSWLQKRNVQLQKPVSIYELHIGSWRRGSGESYLSYTELAKELPAYCKYMGFTHVEFMPVMEHPFYGSWGYQITGYFAPSSRYGLPHELMYLIDELHRNDIGVIFDWVPSHFPTDEHGPGYFDGTHLYEHPDPQKGFHPDWKSYIFNYERNEVRSFLISNAIFWLDKYHADGLRVDAVASMLYLDYSRTHGEWSPNIYGGRENLDAVSFLKEFNDTVHQSFGDVMTIAEESTAWPGVTQPVESGGLGFDLKWMMGWMHDTLKYFSRDPVYRKYDHHQITFSMHYYHSEKFVLPLSHDEVVHGKYSLIGKMPGDRWQQFANLRLLYSYMFTHPGAKLLFMGGEIAQQHEWRHDHSLDWHENELDYHRGIQSLIKSLNELIVNEKSFYSDYDHEGFRWIDLNDSENSVLCWRRSSGDEQVLVVANFTPVVRKNYRIGCPIKGTYEEVFNSDDVHFGGSGVKNEPVYAVPIAKHGCRHSLSLILPPLGLIVLRQSATKEFISAKVKS